MPHLLSYFFPHRRRGCFPLRQGKKKKPLPLPGSFLEKKQEKQIKKTNKKY